MELSNSALTIAGSDSGAGAGIQADIKTMASLGVFACSVITSVTAQNTLGVTAVEDLSPSIIKAQLDAVFTDFGIKAVKLGMISSEKIASEIVNVFNLYNPQNIVLDPVMVATSGDQLSTGSAMEFIVRELFPKADIITPNIFEAEKLLKSKISSLDDMKFAIDGLLKLGAKSVLIKGGHLEGNKSIDVWKSQDCDSPLILEADHVQTNNTHGTGCSLSSAIAAYLANGKSMKEAAVLAKNYISNAIKSAQNQKIGNGHGPVNHFWNLKYVL